MLKICPAKTPPFIWVGILCQAQRGLFSVGLPATERDADDWQS